MKKEGFKPIIDKNAEILVLGTMPGIVSLQTGEYYANKKNQFWKIIFTIFNDGHGLVSYKTKIALLLNNKIGLWDVLTKAEREGSLDSNINYEEFNDFETLFKEFPKIKIVVFNGKKAADYFKSFKTIPKGKEYYILPSTSSANTWKTFDQKLNEWKEILEKTMANKS